MRTPRRASPPSRRFSVAAVLCAVLITALAAPAFAQRGALAVRVRHVPVASASAGEDLTVPVEIEVADRLAEITLRYRLRGFTTWRASAFRRAEATGSRFVAVVPAAELLPGVLDYYIESRLLGAQPGDPPELHFASPEDPHPVIVVGDAEARWQRELLAAHLYQRSQLQLRFEWTDLGSRAVPGGGSVRDDFWRLEGDYSYRLLGWIYSLRLGFGVLRGNTWFHDAQAGDPRPLPDPAACDLEGSATHHYCAVGLTYGFAEMRFRFGRYVRLDLKAILGAGPTHFDGGAGGQLVFGNALGSHFDIGIEGVSSVGTRGWLRLAWDTVPHVPMSFTVEVLNLPDNGDVAGRIFLTLHYRPSRHLRLEALGGYGTRGWRIGGPVLGGAAVVEF